MTPLIDPAARSQEACLQALRIISDTEVYYDCTFAYQFLLRRIGE